MNKIFMCLVAMGLIVFFTPAFAEQTTPVVIEGFAPVVTEGNEKSKAGKKWVNWRTSLVTCPLKNDPREDGISSDAVGIAALIGLGVDILISSARSAISAAAADKQYSAEAHNADYLFVESVIAEGADKEGPLRACAIVGYSSEVDHQGPYLSPPAEIKNQEKKSDWESESLEKIIEVNPDIGKMMKKDYRQLGLIAPEFLARISFLVSKDLTALMPELTYLYYPKEFIDRNKEQTLAIGVDIEKPGQGKDKTILSALILTEKISPMKDGVFTPDNINVKSKYGWFPVPGQTAPSKGQVGYSLPVNIVASVTATAEGSKFAKALNKYINDAAAKQIGDYMKTKLTPGSTDVRNQVMDAHKSAVIDYYSAEAVLAAACVSLHADQDNKGLKAKASAAFWGAKLAYEKLQRLNNSFPNEGVSVDEPMTCSRN